LIRNPVVFHTSWIAAFAGMTNEIRYDMHDIALTSTLFFFIALLYSTVGHAGASGYLATMALLSFAPAEMKPAALTLNVIVAVIASVRFYQAGYFSWRLLWPFAATSVPMAYLGGSLPVHTGLYKILVGIALVFAALHLVIRSRSGQDQAGGEVRPAMAASIGSGGVIGFVSGLTGVGGGIFLSPVLLIMNWAGLKQAAAASAVFILLNSLSGLAGYLQKGGDLPPHLGVWSLAVIAGGFIGSTLGATRLNNPVLKLLLGFILFGAGLKLVVI
jgi:hypothetical protein